MTANFEALGMTEAEWLAKVEEARLESRNACLPAVDALLFAGWKFELPEIVNHNPPKHNWSSVFSEPWQFYWRSPPKRKGSKGGSGLL